MAFSLFKKKKKKEDDRYDTLTVKEVVHIAKDAINIVFEAPEVFSYEPGQFLTIIDTVGGEKIRRAYSLSSSPGLDANPAVTVKRVPGGRMSNHLNDHLKAGDKLEVMKPMGMFTTQYSADNERHTVFFGGGSGITPLISMFRTVLTREPHSKVSLVYGNRSEEYIIFKTLIDELKAQYPDRFNLYHVLEDGSGTYSGRFTPEMIAAVCKEIGADQQTEFYICGPEPLMNIVKQSLADQGYADEKVRLESFEAGKTDTTVPTAAGDVETVLTVVLDGEETQLTLKRSETVLDVALDNDLDMPYSCQSGICTACRGKCVEGKVTVEEAEGLSQEELDEGYILTCVGKPLTDKVKIEMG